MSEPITYEDALDVSIAMQDLALSTVAAMRAVAAELPASVERADRFRATADWLEACGKRTTDILRRAADQIDPPEPVPAEPDLTTADGWSALASDEADAGGQLPAIGSAEECAVAATARRGFDHGGPGWSLLTEALADWASTRRPR